MLEKLKNLKDVNKKITKNYKQFKNLEGKSHIQLKITFGVFIHIRWNHRDLLISLSVFILSEISKKLQRVVAFTKLL